MSTTPTDHGSGTAWQQFWDRGGFWRAALACVGYLALYLGASLLIGVLLGDQVDPDDLFASLPSVLVGLTLPLVVGAVVLSAFVRSLGWFRELFARQPLPGRGWMWVAPVVVGAAVLLRFAGIDYRDYTLGVVVLTVLTGLLIGFVEEVLTRGVAVRMLRRAGHSERVVMVLSSLLFAVLHSANALSGQAIGLVLLTMVFTFGFGICMYLTMRVTRSLWAPVLLHGLYDPTLFLSAGGIDQVSGGGDVNVALTLAAPANILCLVIAVVALLLVRGRVAGRTADHAAA